MWWNLWLLLYYKFTDEFDSKEFFKIDQHLTKLRVKKVDCHKCPVRQGTVLLQDELAWGPTYGTQELL